MQVLLSLVCLSSVAGLRQRGNYGVDTGTVVESNGTWPEVVDVDVGLTTEFPFLDVKITIDLAPGNNPPLNLTGPPLAGRNCEELEGIIIRGHDAGAAAAVLCRAWPSFIPFPVAVPKTILELFRGIDQVWSEYLRITAPNNGVCMKTPGFRELITSNNSSTSLQGRCDMKFLGGCYGSCPIGMAPTPLVGDIAPVCGTVCAQTAFTVECGPFCTDNAIQCVDAFISSFTKAADVVLQAVSLFPPAKVVKEAIEFAMSLIGFVVKILNVLEVALTAWEGWPIEQVVFGVLLTIVMSMLQGTSVGGIPTTEIIGWIDWTVGFFWDLLNLQITIERPPFVKWFVNKVIGEVFEVANLVWAIEGVISHFVTMPLCEGLTHTNPDYDCDADGEWDCGKWDFWGFKCAGGHKCDYLPVLVQDDLLALQPGPLFLNPGVSCRCSNLNRNFWENLWR